MSSGLNTMRSTKIAVFSLRFILFQLVILFASSEASQCPWQISSPQLQAACLCASNTAKEVSIQCDAADYQLLLKGLEASTRSPSGNTVPIDLLYVNNSSLETLGPELVKAAGVVPRSLQVSGCQIRSVAADAFQPLIGDSSSLYRGEPSNLRNLNLHSNFLENVPVEALRPLTSLTLLDLSHNRITNIPIGAFSSLRSLTTLRLGGNPFAIKVPGAGAFRGLATSLRNLDLKATRQRVFPAAAIKGLRALAFLDLSQNSIREISADEKADGKSDGPISPTYFVKVLDLGFNLVANIPSNAFKGTPSLTLLALDGNPLPTLSAEVLEPVALSLRGLSIGGRSLNCDCRLKWLAKWIQHGTVPGGINGSAGSSDLQVTSRERDPQFCGTPARLKETPFHLIQPEELVCVEDDNKEESLKEEVKEELKEVIEEVELENEKPWAPTAVTSTSSTNRPPITTYKPPVGLDQFPTTKTTTTTTTTPTPGTTLSTTTTTTTTARPTTTTTATTSTDQTPTEGPTGVPSYVISKQPQILKYPPTSSTIPRNKTTTPPIVRIGDSNLDKKKNKEKQPKLGEPDEVPGAKYLDLIVQSIARQDNSVIIRWEPANKGHGGTRSSGYRVIYRLFGESTFRRGPPLEPTEREFRIKNVPLQECIVVCVTSLDRPSVTPESVPFSQCKEVRTSPSGHGANQGTPPPGSSTGGSQHMDKITIAASAAICGTVVLAVVVFVATSRKKKSRVSEAEVNEKKAALAAAGLGPGMGMIGPHQMMHPHLVPMHAIHPVAYSQKGTINRSTLYGVGAPTSQAPTMMLDQMPPPMSTGMGAGIASDWEQGSVYSGRSIPRPQVYPEQMTSAGPMTRSHASRLSGKGIDGIGNSRATNAGGSRSMADGQSQRSYSGISNNNYLSGARHPLARPSGLRMSQHSLTNISLASERMSGRASGTGYPHSYDIGANTCQHQQRARKNQGGNNRGGGGNNTAKSRRRYGQGGSGGGYDTTSDNNWTDHDLDIYVARNPTRASGRGGDRLVQL
ncbi:hypothetical protein J437_LFUL011412 [Ladona fulva]|uniref:Fibronectin type-III domain-containing protein n=1 Tax=Ladona fulva TaxID=123851 RepID=A0A8K0KGK9_LADFU|nr:hypothetical protein J437_LFUL011412 [Ladona fulva]